MIEDILRRLNDLHRRLRQLEIAESGQRVYLQTPLTSTSWDGDARSDTNWTLIDLSAVFGVPAGIKAVLVRTSINDSASATTNAYFVLSPTNSGVFILSNNVYGLPNDVSQNVSGWVPCDVNGDIYFGVEASGAGTMDVYMEIWGYER